MFSGQLWSVGLFQEPCNNASCPPLTLFPRNCLKIRKGRQIRFIITFCDNWLLVTMRRSVLKVKVCAWISQHSGISHPSTLSLLISFETGHCHHMPFPYSSSSSSRYSPQPLLFIISSLPFSVSKSSSGFLIVGGGGAWNSAEFWPTLSCQPPTLPRALDTPSLGLVGDQVGDFAMTKEGDKRKKQLRLHNLNIWNMLKSIIKPILWWHLRSH